MPVAPAAAVLHSPFKSMELRPLTHDEATEICEDFEDLKDTEFRYGPAMLVVDDIYISIYGTAEPAEGADMSETGYDVVIAASDVDNTAYYLTIRDYTQVRGVQYNFPE
jgi:hypothetical protein